MSRERREREERDETGELEEVAGWLEDGGTLWVLTFILRWEVSGFKAEDEEREGAGLGKGLTLIFSMGTERSTGGWQRMRMIRIFG